MKNVKITIEGVHRGVKSRVTFARSNREWCADIELANSEIEHVVYTNDKPCMETAKRLIDQVTNTVKKSPRVRQELKLLTQPKEQR